MTLGTSSRKELGDSSTGNGDPVGARLLGDVEFPERAHYLSRARLMALKIGELESNILFRQRYPHYPYYLGVLAADKLATQITSNTDILTQVFPAFGLPDHNVIAAHVPLQIGGMAVHFLHMYKEQQTGRMARFVSYISRTDLNHDYAKLSGLDGEQLSLIAFLIPQRVKDQYDVVRVLSRGSVTVLPGTQPAVFPYYLTEFVNNGAEIKIKQRADGTRYFGYAIADDQEMEKVNDGLSTSPHEVTTKQYGQVLLGLAMYYRMFNRCFPKLFSFYSGDLMARIDPVTFDLSGLTLVTTKGSLIPMTETEWMQTIRGIMDGNREVDADQLPFGHFSDADLGHVLELSRRMLA